MHVEADALILELVDQLGSHPGKIDPEPLHPIVEIGIHRFDHRRAASFINVNGGDTTGIDVIQKAAIAHAGDRRVAGCRCRRGLRAASATPRTQELPGEEEGHGYG